MLIYIVNTHWWINLWQLVLSIIVTLPSNYLLANTLLKVLDENDEVTLFLFLTNFVVNSSS